VTALLQSLKTRLWATLRAKRVSPVMAAALASSAALVSAAGLFAASATFSGSHEPGSVQSEWRPPSLQGFEPSPSKSMAEDTEILKRPVFEKSRRLTESKAKSALDDRAAKEPASAPPTLSVAGIVHFGDKARAFLSSDSDAGGAWYVVGEKVAGWTVAEIRRIGLTLTSGQRFAELKLYPDVQASPQTLAPPSPPPPPLPNPRARKRG
jgi:hypothetical protein